jgi:hypothetical protein
MQRSRIVQTLNVGTSVPEVGSIGGVFPFAKIPKIHGRERTAHMKCGMYLLGPSLAAALPDELFEHPAGLDLAASDVRAIQFLACHNHEVFRSLLEHFCG